ncbi:MAG: hypothetical protein ACK4IY_00760, partial [Chitinophagales bacterium]
NDYSIIERRQNGNKSAADILNKVINRSRFIHAFPFVRSVNISGSLSKNYFDAESDIDFFIIAHPNRMWLCRTLLTVYKKLFLLNSRKYFCINYFIDTEAMEIPDKNIFTATEIITLKNMTGESVYHAFMQKNKWVTNYYPNFSAEQHFIIAEKEKFTVKTLTEKILNNRIGNWLDNFCLHITLYFWKRKFKELSLAEFETNLRSRKHVSKHHPKGFQFKVLVAFDKKCRAFEQQHNVTL